MSFTVALFKGTVDFESCFLCGRVCMCVCVSVYVCVCVMCVYVWCVCGVCVCFDVSKVSKREVGCSFADFWEHLRTRFVCPSVCLYTTI